MRALNAAECQGAERVARDVLDSLLEGCQVIDFDWKYCYVNATIAAQARQSREQLVGRTMMECYPGIEHSAMFAVLRKCMAERAHDRMENEFTFPDGAKGWFELRFVPVPVGMCILSLDITERKNAEAALARSEEQLRQAQKMEAVGRLAGGVAHDFNNLLSVILSYASMAVADESLDALLREDLAEIVTAGHRAAELTAQLLTFSRQQVLQPKIVDLNDSLVKMDKMLQRVLGEDIELRSIAAPSLWQVKADPGQVEQIVMNLAVNARDAMPEGGKLTIETCNVELDERYAREHVGTAAGPHVMLAVSDTGTGMDKATQARIFEPFFTTKEIGKGTGLGLSTCFGIVQQSGGSIWVYSEPGKGATFKVYFPRAEPVSEPVVIRPPQESAHHGKETILLVEDDEQLRHLARGILERRGYDVLVAAGPTQALKQCEDHDGPLDLLLTDVVMPKMSGRQLAERVKTRRPDTKVLYMSGYTGNVVDHHRLLDAGVSFLQKPITPDALARAVRQVLDGAAGESATHCQPFALG